MVSEGGDGCIAELDPSGCLTGLGPDGGLVASSTLERATLTRRTACKLQAQYNAAAGVCKVDNVTRRQAGGGGGGGGVFWMLVIVLLLLALSNLALTFFAMGVLRLGVGMESIEFITSPKSMLKFFGLTDLGAIQQHDGVLATYDGEPLAITGDNSQVSLGLNTVRPSPALHVAPKSVHFVNVNRMQVVEPETGRPVFNTARPSFAVPRGVRNLHVQRAQTPRVASPTEQDLGIRADSTIRVKGNEGVTMEGRALEWNADQDIFLRSLNGSLVLDGGLGGIFVEVNNLPLAGPVDHLRDRGQYKLCVCHRPGSQPPSRPSSRGQSSSSKTFGDKGSTLAEGHLFRVPVPIDNIRRSREHQINCASFTNPCMMM